METETRERYRSAVLGMKVVSISEGLELGQIRQIVISPEYKAAGFIVRCRHVRDERMLSLSSVSSFGEDRITIERQSLLERTNSFARQNRRLRGPLTLVGSRVFTAGGKVLGRVEDYSFSTADGILITLELSAGPLQERLRLPAGYIIAVSPQTVMIKDEALAESSPSESAIRSGISSAWGALTGAAGTLADATRQGAKKLSSSLRASQPDQEQEEAVADAETLRTGEEAAEEKTAPEAASQEYPI